MNLRHDLQRLLIAISLCALATVAGAQGGQIGRVLLASGDAVAVRNGQPIRLAFNSPVQLNDTLRTGPASSLQIRFADEGLLSLRENSEFAVDEYRFADGAAQDSERAFFRLIKGGFRSVTGLIGRARNANYRVQTQTATIGIRGTDYAARQCAGDCGANVKDGLYGTVLGLSAGTNQITITNSAGETPFGINQHFYVPDANTRPQPLLQPPTFVSLRPQGKAQSAQQGGQGNGGEQASSSSGASAESRPQAVVDASNPTGSILPTTEYTVTDTVSSTGGSALLPGNTYGVLGGWLTPGSTNSDGGGGGALVPASALTLGANGLPTAFNIPSGCVGPNTECTSAPSAALGTPNQVGSGFPNGSANGIFWGRWSSGTITENGQTTTLSSTNQAHLMYGTFTPADVISAKTGTLSMSSVSLGTQPTNNLGQTMSGGSFPTISVDFSARTASTTAYSLNFASQNWSLPAGSGAITTAGGGAFFLVKQTGGTCSGSCTGAANGQAAGIFLGPVGDHVGVSLSAGTTSGAAFNAVRVYCPSGC